MADALLMALGTTQVQSVTTGATTQDATKIPSTLTSVPLGTLIKGFVINRDQQNNPILRTSHGDVLVKSDVFLKTGSEVVIRVDNLAQQVRARIITVDNIPIKDLIEMQQQKVPVQQDTVLQSSLAPRQPMAMPAATTPATAGPSIILEGVMLKPTNTMEQSVSMLESIFNLPKPVAQAITQGQPLYVRVVASDMQTATPQLPGLAPGQAQLPAPDLSAPATSMPPSLQAARYMAYGQQTAPAPLPPSVNISAGEGNIALPQIPSTLPASAETGQRHILVPDMASKPGLMSQPLTPANATPSQTAPLAPTIPSGAAPTSPPMQAAAGPGITVPPQSAAPTPLPSNPPSATTLTTAAPPPAATVTASGEHPFTHQAIQNAPPAHTMTARVIGTEAGGETVVRTPVGIFKLFTAAPPPPGSTLMLEIALPPQPGTATGFLTVDTSYNQPATGNAQPLTHEWKSLHESLAMLRQDPIQFAELNHRIPNTKSDFVNSALFFISALKSGAIRQWLGDRVSTRLEERASPLLQRLSADFSNISALGTDKPDQSWNLYAIPFRHEEELQQARLYVRREQNKESKNSRQAIGTRFVVEVTLSEMGDMQLDGLVRTQDKNVLFDLIVRSEQPLDNDVQSDISALFSQGAQAVGYAGNVLFQPGRERFMFPNETLTDSKNSDNHNIIA